MSAPAPRPLAGRPARDLRVEAIRDRRGLEELRPSWQALAERAGAPHPFATHEWVTTWWDCFGGRGDLLVLTVKEGDETVAIAPLHLRRRRLYGLAVRSIGFTTDVHAQRFDLLVRPDRPDAYRAIWRALADRGGWDLVELAQIPEGSPTLSELRRLAQADGYLTGLWPSSGSPYLAIDGDYEGYLRRLGGKHVANLRRRERRLADLGVVRMETVDGLDGLVDALRDGLRIEAAAWKGRAGTAIGSDPARRRLYTEFAARAVGRGWLRLHFLSVGGRRIAFDYSLVLGGRTFMLKPGYDPAYARYSPYALLLMKVLRGEFARGATEFEFLGDAEPWKLEWTARVKRHQWLYLMAPTSRMRLLHAAKFRLVRRLQRHRAYHRLRDAARAAVLAAASVRLRPAPSRGARPEEARP